MTIFFVPNQKKERKTCASQKKIWITQVLRRVSDLFLYFAGTMKIKNEEETSVIDVIDEENL